MRLAVGLDGTERQEALRALHRDYAPVVARFVMSRCHDEALTQDIVAETLLRAWQHPEALQRPEAGLRAWLFTVARNLLTDQWRSARHRHEVVLAVVPDTVAADPMDALVEAWVVREALATLTVEHREVITRAYFHGEDTQSMAVALGIPPGTVKSRLHYGLHALRRALQERGVEAP